ncbi:MAG: HDOD domain-containing protein [Azonexus sp.]|jgi:HD-like signal output (HDOD) protein|nr:HDOD domain-containing protein [Azonexus sp.]
MNAQAALEAIVADAVRGNIVFPTHADIALRVRRLLDDPDCPAEQLSRLVAAEPMLTAHVVAIANSAAYNPAGRKASDVRSAVTRLGFNTLRSLTAAVIVRQMASLPVRSEYRALAARLWQHSAHVAALSRVIAARVTHLDPEVAFFAGIVHEIGGFYLIARADAFPGLLDSSLEHWLGEHEATVGRSVLTALDVPETVRQAIDALWEGYLSLPARSLGDTLLLADQLTPVESPLAELSGMGNRGLLADINQQVDGEELRTILADSANEVATLIAALHA